MLQYEIGPIIVKTIQTNVKYFLYAWCMCVRTEKEELLDIVVQSFNLKGKFFSYDQKTKKKK